MKFPKKDCCEVCYLSILTSCDDLFDEDKKIKDKVNYLIKESGGETHGLFKQRRAKYLKILIITHTEIPGQMSKA